jgi:hypothetical protein
MKTTSWDCLNKFWIIFKVDYYTAAINYMSEGFFNDMVK